MEKYDVIINNLLQHSGSNRVETKVDSSPEAVAQTVTAFVNGCGGDLLLGVDEGKKIVGFRNGQQFRLDIQKYLLKNIAPVAPFSINLLIYNFKPLMLISVWEGANKPYSYKSNIYFRKNGENKIVDINENVGDETNEETSEETIEGADLNSLHITEGVKVELLKLYAFIKENPFVRVSEIQTHINKSSATVERYLKILRDNRLIHFEGSRNHKIGGYKTISALDD